MTSWVASLQERLDHTRRYRQTAPRTRLSSGELNAGCIKQPVVGLLNDPELGRRSSRLRSRSRARPVLGGWPRFNVVTTAGLFFLGCNNVVPKKRHYLLVHGGERPALADHRHDHRDLDPIDVQGMADISNIKVNGVAQVVLVGPPTSKAQCKKGGWKNFNNPSFRNQGQCVSYAAHHSQHGKSKHALKHHA